MSKRFRNKFERSERDFCATPIQSVAPSVSHLQAAGRRMPRDAAGRFEWEDSAVKRNKFEMSYGETAAKTSGTSGSATPR